MSIAITDLENNVTLEESALNNLMGGCGIYIPPCVCVCAPCVPVKPIWSCGWGSKKLVMKRKFRYAKLRNRGRGRGRNA